MNISRKVEMILLAGLIMTVSGVASAKSERETGRMFSAGPEVYVTSQGLYYDTIVVTDTLPMKGNFQQLIPTENGLETEFGPGEVGHLGGRWWIDANDNYVMDEGDLFFLCPLLGPGRESSYNN